MAQNKFSLFLLETEFGFMSDLYQECFKYVETFNSLDKAKEVQKEYKKRTIILPSY